jgi:hypothetical protein
LERRWHQALGRVAELEPRINQHRGERQPIAPPTLDKFSTLTADLDAVWHHPETDVRLNKRIVRTLIHEVVADVDSEAGDIMLIVPWQGGVHTEWRLPRRRRGPCTHTAKAMVEAVRGLVRLCSDDLIAGVLNRHGLRTGRGNRWTRERVTGLRRKHHIPCHHPEQRASPGWMNLTEAAKFLGISPRTRRIAVERGELEAPHPLHDGPGVVNRRALETNAAVTLVERVRERAKAPAKPAAEQTNLDFPIT